MDIFLQSCPACILTPPELPWSFIWKCLYNPGNPIVGGNLLSFIK